MRQALHFLKATGLMSLILLLSLQTFAQTATPPSAGDGSDSNPYEIATLENLYWLSQSDTAWDKHYIQTADIDASPTDTLNDNKGFSPIGNTSTQFTGTYNGDGYKIRNLVINRPNQNNIGLLGLVKNGAEVTNLGITGATITGNKKVGGLTGNLKNATVKNCYTTGTLKATGDDGFAVAGGLLGKNVGTIEACYSSMSVTSDDGTLGGFVGRNGGTIENSYATGKVTGTGAGRVGGFVGDNKNGIIKQSHSFGRVKCNDYAKGGFNGYNQGTINHCFWDTETSGQNTSAGGTGKITPEMKSPYTFINEGWDFMNETSNGEDDYWGINPDENGGYPFLSWQGFAYQTPLSVKTQKTTNIDTSSATGNIKILAPGTSEITAHGICWDTTATPTHEDNHTDGGSVSDTGTFASNITGLKEHTTYYVRAYATNSDTTIYGNEVTFGTLPSYSKPEGDGTENNPYKIANLKNLTWLMDVDTAWGKYYIQTADINASATAIWLDGKGFIPIGNSNTEFSGTYNGQYHKIDSLNINRESENNIGLFGLVKGNSAQVEKLALTNVNVTGKKNVGSIAGNNRGNIYQCYATGKLNSKASTFSDAHIGGLAGLNSDTIKNSFSKVNVTTGGDRAGGIAGNNRNSGLIINCYSHGEVSGNYDIGGIVGYNKAKIKYCFSTSPVNGFLDIGGIVGNNYYGNTQNSFWDTETSGQNSSFGGTGKTTAEMQTPYTFINEGWDFMNETGNGEEDIWGINPDENGGYPFLSWQGYTYQTPLVVKTQEVTNIGSNSAKETIKILAPGTSEITAHGACWDTIATPTHEGNHADGGSVSDTGTFAFNIAGFKEHTTYYLRAYATNSDTTVYGNEVTFATLPSYSKPEGDGTENNPYQIANLENLTWLMAADTAWGKHYIQTADIDASATNSWYSGEGFIPIGNSNTNFTGTYNGQRHKIDSLNINRESENNIGLFGLLKGNSAQVEKLALTNVNVTGKKNVGSIAGNNRGNIYQCYATGNLNSNASYEARIGGLAGLNSDTIKNSFSKVNVTTGGDMAGGIAGKNGSSGLIANCYSNGKISGDRQVGGIVGMNYKGKVKYCYSTSITDLYGGIVRMNSGGTIQKSFWDKETSGAYFSDGGTGLSTSKMKEFSTYHDAGWNFTIWGYNPAANNGYPFLKWQGYPDDIPVFVVETDQIASLTPTTANINGVILGLGSTDPTAHGICWNSTGTPTTADNLTDLGAADTTGEFTSQITGLDANSEYFARVYASNNDTTVYGDEITFTTPTKELELDGTFTAGDKIYDGTNQAEITADNLSLTGIIADDEVIIDTVIVHFSDSAVGENKYINITEITLEGGDKDKYYMNVNSFPVASANITPKELTVTDATVEVKIYDGTTDAVITGATLQGVISGDNVTLNATTGAFATANVGTDIAVSTSMTLSGGQAANYEIAQPSGLTGNITAKEITISGSFDANSKVYDGTQNATIAANNLTLEGNLEQDNVTFQPTSASFAQTQSASNITVSITAGQLEGSDTGNYNLSLANAPDATADITPKELTVANASVQDKTYDGTTNAVITGASLEGIISGDNVTIDDAIGSFATEDVGTDIAVTPAMTITGAQAGNYQLTQPANLFGNITAKETSIGGDFKAEDKVYDGTNEATVTNSNLTLNRIVSGDDIILSNLEVGFAQAAQGPDIDVNINTADITGADAGNYTLSLTDAPSANATITPKELTVKGASAEDKVYDGTMEAVITGASLEGIISEDNVTIDDAIGSFATEDIGTDIAVTPAMTITGTQADNYQLTQPANLTANISARTTTIGGSFNVANKEYDDTKKATITTINLSLDSIINDDDVALTSVKASFTQVGPGSGITAEIENADITGNDAGNYSLSLTGAPTTTADITEVTDIINAATDKVKLYPNPFRDFIMIESEREIIKVEITDMSGTTSIIENPERRINTSKLEGGLYLIILEDDQGIRYRRKMTRQ